MDAQERERARLALIEYHTQAIVDRADADYLTRVRMAARAQGLTRDELLDKMVEQQRGVEQLGSSRGSYPRGRVVQIPPPQLP